MILSRLASIVLALALAVVAPRLHAMSVRAPTFPELVAESTTVARARVVSVSSRMVAGANGTKAMKTFVTFSMLKPIKGEAPAEFTLSFLGGTEKGERWVVPGMPTFEVGEETFVFASGQESICPLVGAMHGRYRVLTDSADGRRYVARDNREPLSSTDEVATPMESSGNARTNSAKISAALTPEDFEKRITAEITNPTRPAKLQ